MLRESIGAAGRAASELTRLSIQSVVLCIRASRLVSPPPGLVGEEANAPGFRAIPEAIDFVCFALGGGKDRRQQSFLDGVTVINRALEFRFEALPFRYVRRRGAQDTEADGATGEHD